MIDQNRRVLLRYFIEYESVSLLISMQSILTAVKRNNAEQVNMPPR